MQGCFWETGERFCFVFYLCKSICLCGGTAFFAESCCFGALALLASNPPEPSWFGTARFRPLPDGLLVSAFFAWVPWDSDLGGRPLLGLGGTGCPVSSVVFSSVFWWIFSAPAAAAVLFFPRSELTFPCVVWSELISWEKKRWFIGLFQSSDGAYSSVDKKMLIPKWNFSSS